MNSGKTDGMQMAKKIAIVAGRQRPCFAIAQNLLKIILPLLRQQGVILKKLKTKKNKLGELCYGNKCDVNDLKSIQHLYKRLVIKIW